MWSLIEQFPLETAMGRAALVGLLLGVVGYLTLLASAFKESRVWGILILAFPPAAFRYAIANWDENKKPFLALILGLAMLAPLGGDLIRQHRDKLADKHKLGPEIFEDKEAMAEMELMRTGGTLLSEAVGRRGNLYQDLGAVDELGSPLTNRPRPPQITHPDIPADLDTAEKQATTSKQLAAEQAELEKRRQAIQPGDAAALTALRADVLAYNQRAIRHRKAVEALRQIQSASTAPFPVSPPVAAQQ